MKVQITEVPTGGIPENVRKELQWMIAVYDEDVPVDRCRDEVYGYRDDAPGYVLKTRHVLSALTELRRDTAFGFFQHFPYPYLWVPASICEFIPD